MGRWPLGSGVEKKRDGAVRLLGRSHCWDELLSVVVVTRSWHSVCVLCSNLGSLCGCALGVRRHCRTAFFTLCACAGRYFCLLSLSLLHFHDRSYFRVYLGVDEEDLADAPDGGSLQTEGLFSSVALFVLTWTLSYSLVHAAA